MSIISNFPAGGGGGGGGMKTAVGPISGWTNSTPSALSVTGLDFTPKIIILKWGNDCASYAWDGVGDMNSVASWSIVMCTGSTYTYNSGYAKPIQSISVGNGFVTATFINSNRNSTCKYMLIGD